jgi:hypothetical protein
MLENMCDDAAAGLSPPCGTGYPAGGVAPSSARGRACAIAPTGRTPRLARGAQADGPSLSGSRHDDRPAAGAAPSPPLRTWPGGR